MTNIKNPNYGGTKPVPPSPDSASSEAPKADTQTLYGVKACMAMLEHRPDDLHRLYHAPGMRRELRGMLSWAAARHIPYRELGAEELARIAKSTHHEGVVVVCRPLRHAELSPEIAREAAGRGELWMALDGVSNPHNMGGIVRSCAFFGATGILAGGAAPGEKVNAAIPRVAEGGAEHVRFFAAGDFAKGLRSLREAGFLVIGLETGGPRPLEEALSRPVKDTTHQPLALVMGQEREGLRGETARSCSEVCHIQGVGPGSPTVSSLNVSVAAGVALAAASRRRQRP